MSIIPETILDGKFITCKTCYQPHALFYNGVVVKGRPVLQLAYKHGNTAVVVPMVTGLPIPTVSTNGYRNLISKQANISLFDMASGG